MENAVKTALVCVVAIAVAATPARADDALPPAVALDGPVACTVAGKHLDSRAAEKMQLDFEPSGGAFASIDAEAVTVSFAEEPRRAALLSVAGAGLHLQGFMPADDVALFPARSFVVGGVLRPFPRQKMHYRTASQGRVGLRFEGDEFELLASPDAACADVTLDVVDLELPEVRGAKNAKTAVWRDAERPVAIAALAGGPVALTLDEPFAFSAQIIEEKADFARILLHVKAGEIIGWVPRAKLNVERLGGSHQAQAPRVRFPPPRVAAPTVRCPHDVAVIARLGEVMRVIGHYDQGAGIAVSERDGSFLEPNTPFFHIRTTTTAARPAPDAEWLVRASDIADCTPIGMGSTTLKSHHLAHLTAKP